MTREQIIQASYDFSKAESIFQFITKGLLKPGDVVLTTSGTELIYLKEVNLGLDFYKYNYFPNGFYLFSDIIGKDENSYEFEKSVVCLKHSEKVLLDFQVFHDDWEVLTLENIPIPEEDKIMLIFDNSFQRVGVIEYYPFFYEKTETSLIKLELPTWKSSTIGFDISHISKERILSRKVKFKVVQNPDKKRVI